MPLLRLKNGKQVWTRVVAAQKESKSPIVFVHGLGSSETFYGSLFRSGLCHERRCICLDTPGSARSPLPDSEQSVESISEDVISLLDTLELEKVVLVGHSMGGMIACNIAATNVKRVEKLILVGPVHPTPEGAKMFQERIKKVKKGASIKKC